MTSLTMSGDRETTTLFSLSVKFVSARRLGFLRDGYLFIVYDLQAGLKPNLLDRKVRITIIYLRRHPVNKVNCDL